MRFTTMLTAYSKYMKKQMTCGSFNTTIVIPMPNELAFYLTRAWYIIDVVSRNSSFIIFLAISLARCLIKSYHNFRVETRMSFLRASVESVQDATLACLSNVLLHDNI